MSKQIKETTDGVQYSVDKDEMDTVSDVIKQHTEPGDTIQVTDSVEDKVTETLKIGMNPILNSLGIDMTNKTPEETKSIKSMLKQFVDILNQRGVTNLVLREDDDLPEIPDQERMERGDEYGVTVHEDFDKIMEELKKSNAPVVKLSENIRPRIKKSDLINYIKNKK